MRVIKSVGLVVLGVLLGIAGSMASERLDAQATTAIERAQEILPGQRVGPIITGENIGFQLHATDRRGVATGMLMIKVNGRWLPTATPTGMTLAK
jgi:hypothetical protein